MKLIAESYGFQGGRFYRGRYVLTVSFRISSLPSFSDSHVSFEKQQSIESLLDSVVPHSTVTKWPATRRSHGCFAKRWEFENGDLATIPVFGITSEQFFNRLMANKRWTYDSGRSFYWCESELLPYPLRWRRNKGFKYDAVPKCDRGLFGKFTGATPRYDGLELGPERKPPLYVCNLCGREAVWKSWPIRDTPGLANSDYISACPQCKSQRGDFFGQVKTALQEIGALAKPASPGFHPTMKMQDNLFYSPP